MAIRRSITHWTAGGPRANSTDKKHYHRITEFDGTIVKGNEEIADNIVTSDDDYAAHTLNLNTGSAGFSMAGMMGAKESPFDPGPHPINEVQFEAHCAMLAQFHHKHAILPISRTNCLTHAEVQPTLGVRQRNKWDFTRLVFKPELRGALAVGDYMRKRVNSYLGVLPEPVETKRPILRKGDRGAFVLDAQDLLSGAGHPVGHIDGIFGARTENAVRALQSAAELHVDGVIGPMTWRALMRPPEPKERKIVTEDYLRYAGSETIAAADSAEKGAKIAGASLVGLGGVDTALEAVDKVEASSGALSAAQALLIDNWLIILVILIGGLVYWKGPELMQLIKDRRVQDGRSGKHMGR